MHIVLLWRPEADDDPNLPKAQDPLGGIEVGFSSNSPSMGLHRCNEWAEAQAQEHPDWHFLILKVR
jgi:hypothetical protein